MHKVSEFSDKIVFISAGWGYDKSKGGVCQMEATFGFVPMLVLAAIAVVLIMVYFYLHHWAK